MHHLKAEVGTVENISPCVYHMTLTLSNGLVEVKPVKVECHGADAEGGKPDAHDGPCCEEEVQRAAIIKRSILEDQTSEVTVGSDNVICLFFLPKLVSITLRDLFGSLPSEGLRDERSVHS